jgi:4-hydroxy-tetrahydrodipicolinate reductase
MGGALRTVHVGLGTIGLACLRVAAQRPGVQVVGAIDPQPALRGCDAGTAAGLAQPLGVAIAPDWAALPAADAAIVCTTSRFGDLEPTVAAAFERGLDIVSTCETLAGPAPDDPDARALDARARSAGRRLLGAGVNPGFVMDALPLTLAACLSELRGVRVRRVVDARSRRPQLAAKTGAGLSPAEFAAGVARGDLGHVGLPASARLIAAGLGWRIDRLTERTRPILGPDGRSRGARQRLRAIADDGKHRIDLDLTIAVDARPSGDTVWLDGTPPLRWSTRPATAGDEATAALVVNSLGGLAALAPGLRTVVDLVPLRFHGRL